MITVDPLPAPGSLCGEHYIRRDATMVGYAQRPHLGPINVHLYGCSFTPAQLFELADAVTAWSNPPDSEAPK